MVTALFIINSMVITILAVTEILTSVISCMFGQRIGIYFTILVPGFFTRAVHYSLPCRLGACKVTSWPLKYTF